MALRDSYHLFDLTPLAGLTELKHLWISESAPGLDLAPLHGKRMTVHLPRSVELADTARPDGVRVKRVG